MKVYLQGPLAVTLVDVNKGAQETMPKASLNGLLNSSLFLQGSRKSLTIACKSEQDPGLVQLGTQVVDLPPQLENGSNPGEGGYWGAEEYSGATEGKRGGVGAEGGDKRNLQNKE